MNILILGSGGREHALAYTFQVQSHHVWTFPGNGGTESFCEPIPFGDYSMECIPTLVTLAKSIQADLTVVGCEYLLNEGIVDIFKKHGLKVCGPNQKASIIEADKGFAKTFMSKYGIPTAPFEVCDSAEEATDVAQIFVEEWGGCVIKPCGLTGGKGATICKTTSEASKAVKYICNDKRFGPAGKSVVVEKVLKGTEISVLAFCDGTHIIPMIPYQEHKKLFEGDEGPNTEGVGGYAPTPNVTSEMMEKIERVILARTNAGLIQEGIDYRGILCCKLIANKEGIFLQEYHCFLSDLEAQTILPLLRTDLASIMQDCIQGCLKGKISWFEQFACCVVMAVEGYPFTFPTGDVVTGWEIERESTTIFHMGTKRNGSQQLVTAGGRVLGVTGNGPSLAEAAELAYKRVGSIDFVSEYYRKDIGAGIHQRETVGC